MSHQQPGGNAHQVVDHNTSEAQLRSLVARISPEDRLFLQFILQSEDGTLANFRRALVERIVADADELLQARLLHHGRPIPDGPQGNPRPRNSRPQVPVKARPANSTLQIVGIKAPPPHVLPQPPSKARPFERASSRSRSRSRTN